MKNKITLLIFAIWLFPLGLLAQNITVTGKVISGDDGQPAGIYFIEVTDTQGRRCVKKVVKQ